MLLVNPRTVIDLNDIITMHQVCEPKPGIVIRPTVNFPRPRWQVFENFPDLRVVCGRIYGVLSAEIYANANAADSCDRCAVHPKIPAKVMVVGLLTCILDGDSFGNGVSLLVEGGFQKHEKFVDYSTSFLPIGQFLRIHFDLLFENG